VTHCSSGSFISSRKSSFFEPHQHAFGQHRDGGVALGLGDQRFLAEGVAHAELGQPDAFLVQRRLARDQHLPLTMA
jgi:hypothetical protein